MKTDDDIFLLEIEQNQLLNQNKILGEFQHPIRILPSTFDTYGAHHGQSTFICLSNSTYPLVVLTRDNYRLNQCLILSPSVNQYYLFTIDSVKTINTNVYVNIDSPKIVESVANYEKRTDPRDFIFPHDRNKLLTFL